MKIQYKILSLIVLLFSVSFLYAQNTIPPLTYLTTDLGLSQAINYDILQDSRGYMWFTSYDGINKFDSNKITKFTYDYNDKNSFLGNLSIGIVEDKNGNIWTGGTNCLNIYQYNKNKFKHLNVKNNSNFYYYPLFATQNSVIFQKGNCFYVSNINNYESKLLFIDKNFDYVNFSAKTFETFNSYLVFIRGKSEYNETNSKITFRIYEFSKTDMANPKITFFNTVYDVKAIQKVNDNKYIIGTNIGLSLFDLSSKKISPYLSNYFNNEVSSIDDFANNKFLLSTKNGKIYELNLDNNSITLQSFFSEEDEKECKKNGIQKLFVDNQDNVFFTLWGKGIACYDINNSLFKYSFNKSDILNNTINDQYISSMLCLKNDDILIYTKSGDFYTVNKDGKNIKYITNINRFNNTNFGGDLYIHYGFDDRILISGLDKLYELKINENKIVPITINCNGLLDNTINDISIFDSNNYIISAQKGIFIVSKDFKSYYTFDVLNKNEVYTRTFFIQKKYLYVCKPYKGFDLYIFENHSIKLVKSFPINASIKDFFIKEKNEVWFASTLGILKHNLITNKVEVDNSKNKWINTYLYSLLQDDYGNLWISHNAGITKYELAKNKTTHFGLSNGLQGYEFNTKSFAKNSKGILFFGGTNGLNIINPKENYISKNKTIIQFEELKIADKIIDDSNYLLLKNKLILSKNQTTFSLKPVLINYNSCFKQHDLMYKLEGIDKSWISGLSNQTIRYSNLPAGNYRFYIKTPDNNQQKILDITVNQVFWKSLWFWTIILLLSVLLIWFTQRGYYIAQVNKREAELKKIIAVEQERNRIAADMHDDLGSGLTQITYLSEMVTKEMKNNENLIKIKKTSAVLIESMNEIIWAMKEGNNTLEDFLTFTKLYVYDYLENNKINLIMKIPDSYDNIVINGNNRRNLFLCVKESVHNIVKHAQAKQVLINITCDTNLIINIKDDGIGYDFLNNTTKKSGNGLQNMKKRMENLNGSFEIINNNGTELQFIVSLKNLSQ